MFDFAETTKDMTSAEILNYYRNLYYAEPQVTERGIVANAINDYFKDVVPKCEYDAVVSAVDNSTKEFLKLHDEYQNAKREIERLEKENAELLISETTDVHISMEKLVKVRTEHPIFKAIEEKVARKIFEEIERGIAELYPILYAPTLNKFFAELKKKYTEVEK